MPDPAKKKALVLGGGGLTGIGWEVGMLAGLAEAGVDLSDADVVIGTSAGSIVGAQLTSGRDGLEELYERQLAAPDGRPAARMGPAVFARFAATALRSRDAVSFGVRMGRLALAARTVPEAEHRAAIARTLRVDDWPTRRLMVTAVDSLTGERAAFDATSGVPLLDAVSASCAVPGIYPPITLDGKRWVDGGVHSSANADLAEGYERVVVIAPMAVSGGPIVAPRTQAARLAERGARVVVITPDRAARTAFGRNVLDPARRPAAARAGHRQASHHAPALHTLWTTNAP
ncbi:patatin [Streptomyces sp. NRRL F-4489]|uniref:patatin-like phospholipase family protein n=1 Tax=Streptomyces sp. NRRL F-4489 TaxID=1609095 RepID=UPI00074997A2|nr:patatin-like phospholipase family protein [Streptomyces sp. NRRL F-4489]KUL50488.1 patatin [Streptomyces sp. NRRL F-4489]